MTRTSAPSGPALLLAVVAALAALLLASGTGQATVTQQGPEDPEVARAVAALAGPDPGAAPLPAAFLAAHHVVEAGGRPLDPTGGCSSPIDLPTSFDDACRAHDLGYDLLRHAAARGGPLGPWARRALDEQFARDLAAACDDAAVEPLRCHLLAGLADVAVDVNSWRQGWSVPVLEHGPFLRDVR